MSTGLKAAPGSPNDDILPITVEDQEVLEEGRILAPLADCDIDPDPSDPGTPTSRKSGDKTSLISQRLHNIHQKTPILKRFPSFVILPISFLILVNLGVWAIVAIVLRYHP
jgi:hypothetical protein